jgi:hypothetical protein
MRYRHRLSSGKIMKVIEGEIYGLCEDDEMTISNKIVGQLQLEVFIHELLHAEHRTWSEEEVDKRAASIASLLWKVGYRRIKIKKNKRTKKDKLV